MYIQQILGFIIVIFFLARLYGHKRSGQVNRQEFYLWLVFWLGVGLVIASLKYIDALVGRLGFTTSAINILAYLGIAVLFYALFRLRVRMAKLEKDITKVVEEVAIGKMQNAERKNAK